MIYPVFKSGDGGTKKSSHYKVFPERRFRSTIFSGCLWPPACMARARMASSTDVRRWRHDLKTAGPRMSIFRFPLRSIRRRHPLDQRVPRHHGSGGSSGRATRSNTAPSSPCARDKRRCSCMRGNWRMCSRPVLYMLETNNMPIMTTLQHWDHGFKSPFKVGGVFRQHHTLQRSQMGHEKSRDRARSGVWPRSLACVWHLLRARDRSGGIPARNRRHRW